MNNNPCTCGNPKLQGVMHTNHGPCYLYEIGQIDGAVDGEGKLMKLEKLKSYDTLAAQLRERLAQAERQLKAATDEAEKRGEEVVKYRAEADRLREQVTENTPEWLCERCNVIHAPTGKGKVFQPCPDCWNAMTPTSPARREILELRAQVAALQPYADQAAGLLAEKQAHLDAWDEMVRTVKMSE